MNYIKQVAEMLGVEMGERFHIQRNVTLIELNNKPVLFWFDEEGLQSDAGCWVRSYYNSALVELINGDRAIVKRPWKPKKGEGFYYVCADGEVVADVNTGGMFHVVMIAFGNYFKTKADAEAHKDEILAKIKEVFDGE